LSFSTELRSFERDSQNDLLRLEQSLFAAFLPRLDDPLAVPIRIPPANLLRGLLALLQVLLAALIQTPLNYLPAAETKMLYHLLNWIDLDLHPLD